MNGDGGFVRLYRGLLDNKAFRSHAEAMAFAYLVVRASWRKTTIRYKGRVITLERGELALSLRDFARAMERDRNWAPRFLRRLEGEQMVSTRRAFSETAGETAPTIITICNYGKYQDTALRDETVIELFPRQQRDSSETQNNEVKEGKERKKRKGVDLPNWMPIEAWEGWLEMRRQMRKPATEGAQRLAITKLDGFRKRGLSVQTSLEEATLACWTTVWEPKGRSGGNQSDMPF